MSTRNARQHILSNVDPEARTAICAACGPVGIKSNGNGWWRCRIGAKSGAHHKRTVAKRIRFGYISTAEFRKISKEQGGMCAICGGPPTRGHTRLSVDHCHQTDTFRGLICADCNSGLGHLKDDPERLQAALAYLMKHKNGEGPPLVE